MGRRTVLERSLGRPEAWNISREWTQVEVCPSVGTLRANPVPFWGLHREPHLRTLCYSPQSRHPRLRPFSFLFTSSLDLVSSFASSWPWAGPFEGRWNEGGERLRLSLSSPPTWPEAGVQVPAPGLSFGLFAT